jgi:hypothetical protein
MRPGKCSDGTLKIPLLPVICIPMVSTFGRSSRQVVTITIPSAHDETMSPA